MPSNRSQWVSHQPLTQGSPYGRRQFPSILHGDGPAFPTLPESLPQETDLDPAQHSQESAENIFIIFSQAEEGTEHAPRLRQLLQAG